MSVPSALRGLKRLLLRATLLIGVPLAAGVVGLYFYAKGGRFVDTDNAYVKANVIAVSADVSGRVVEVGVEDNQPVEAGQLLFQIDPQPFQLELDRNEAELTMAKTVIESFRADYREGAAQLDEAGQRVRFLERQFVRQESLRKKGLGSEEAYDSARHELDMARQAVRVINKRIERILTSLGGDPDLPVEVHARYLRAKAARDTALYELRHARVAAAKPGVVSNMKLQVGEYVEEGEPVFSIIESSQMWIEANLKETQLTHVREGMPATVVVDAYPDVTWKAQVGAIAPATGAEFALLPPQNASGNWVKVVQRVPVTLRIEPAPDAPPLRAGMTVTVSIDTGRRRQLPEPVRLVIGDAYFPEMVQNLLRHSLAFGEGSQAATTR